MQPAAPVGAVATSFRLIYRSRSLIPPAQRRAQLGALFTTARAHNKREDISGALLLSGDSFVQTLEGEEAAVRDLYARIATDPRHDGLVLLDTDLVPDRVFARWSMARVSDEEGESDLPLLAHRDGIAPAAARGGTTAEQEEVLAFMRAATRG